MKKKENKRLDRFAFALGSITLVTPFTAIPIVPGDRITAAWDERLADQTNGIIACRTAHKECGVF